MRKRLAIAALALGIAVTTAQAEEVYGQLDAPLVAEVLGTKVHTADADEMQYVVLGKLMDQYASEAGIVVASSEVDAYIAAMNRIAEKDRTEREARRAGIAQKLESQTLTPAEKDALSSELAALDELGEMLGAGDNGAEPEEDRAARRQFAEAVIRQWKINQALYRQYGGRIIFQQGGPEPLDAYSEFLEDQQKQGAFRIVDKSMEPAFWRYFRTDSIHSFYASGSEEEARAFETPWWLQDEPAGGQ